MPFWAVLLSVVGIVAVASKPAVVLFLLFVAYVISGYLMWALGRRVRPKP